MLGLYMAIYKTEINYPPDLDLAILCLLFCVADIALQCLGNTPELLNVIKI